MKTLLLLLISFCSYGQWSIEASPAYLNSSERGEFLYGVGVRYWHQVETYNLIYALSYNTNQDTDYISLNLGSRYGKKWYFGGNITGNFYRFDEEFNTRVLSLDPVVGKFFKGWYLEGGSRFKIYNYGPKTVHENYFLTFVLKY